MHENELIKGVWIKTYTIPKDRDYYDIRNPADTRQLIARFPRLKREDVKSAIDVAKEAFAKWSTTLPVERANILYKTAL